METLSIYLPDGTRFSFELAKNCSVNRGLKKKYNFFSFKIHAYRVNLQFNIYIISSIKINQRFSMPPIHIQNEICYPLIVNHRVIYVNFEIV